MGKYGKRLSKKRDPWYNKWLHFGKRFSAGAAGGALGYLYGNVPGGYSGARAAWNVVGKYRRPIRARLGSNARWRFGSVGKRETGSNPGPVLGSNPGPGKSAKKPKGILKKYGLFPGHYHRHHKGVKFVFKK